MDTRYVPPHKKGRYHHHSRRQQASVLPSKFLLGGNINDPLNLNSLGQSDNANTPKTSPMPIPKHRIGEIPIFIPKNPTDPLGLQSSPFSPATATTVADVAPRSTVGNSTKSRRQRRRSLRIRNDSECSTDDKCNVDGTDQVSAFIQPDDSVTNPNPESDLPTVVVNCEQSAHAATVEGKSESTQEETPQQFEPPTSENMVSKGENRGSEGVLEKPSPGPEQVESPVYMGLRRPTSDYVPLSSAHQPSPFVLRDDGLDDGYEMITFPFESPSLARLFNSQQMMNEPFSPPTADMMYLTGRRFPAGHYDYQVQQFPSNPAASSSTKKPKYLNVFQRRWHYRKRIRHNRLDPIVSPVIPQPGVKRMRHHHHHNNQQSSNASQNTASKADKSQAGAELADSSSSGTSNEEKGGSGDGKEKPAAPVRKSFNPKSEIFQYGNYNRYYGYRNASNGDDVRLRMIKKEWIEGKDVLDIGCNVGHITLSVARDAKPRRIVGVDIDNHLITTARKNIKHYVDQDAGDDVTEGFPQYLSVMYGALNPCAQAQPSSSTGKGTTNDSPPFPYNVKFHQENYVLDSDDQLDSVKPEYDTILCLSVTKWIHLNFGDAGLKRFFRRGFRHLRPGGRFVMEPQLWSSYQKKKKLTEKIFNTFKQIQFFPDQFQEFLMKEVGYDRVESVGTPMHQPKGFSRPLLVFTKSPQDTPEEEAS